MLDNLRQYMTALDHQFIVEATKISLPRRRTKQRPPSWNLKCQRIRWLAKIFLVTRTIETKHGSKTRVRSNFFETQLKRTLFLFFPGSKLQRSTATRNVRGSYLHFYTYEWFQIRPIEPLLLTFEPWVDFLLVFELTHKFSSVSIHLICLYVALHR